MNGKAQILFQFSQRLKCSDLALSAANSEGNVEDPVVVLAKDSVVV